MRAEQERELQEALPQADIYQPGREADCIDYRTVINTSREYDVRRTEHVKHSLISTEAKQVERARV